MQKDFSFRPELPSLRRRRHPFFRPRALATLAAILLTSKGTDAMASYLFNDYLDPADDGLSTDYSAWDFATGITPGQYPFYAPYGDPNYPTTAAPFGNWTTASAAGVTNPGGGAWASQNPSAFWDSRNPTITQTGTPTAFITSDGNIYSYAAPTSFVLNDSTSYNLGTVVFQFQTEGSLVDFSSIELEYTNTTGTHLLSANDWIQEYDGSTSAYGGLTNRLALQWDLAGLGIKSFQIVLTASDSSMSLQQALLDTASTYTGVVPSSGNWTGGSGNWSNTTLWALNSINGNRLPKEDANATFSNSANATVNLDANHTVAQLTFDTPFDTTISSTSGNTLTSNTGITTTAQSTGTYTINTGFALNALNLFHINAGTVTMNGAVSGPYGIAKDGNGTLVLGANNSFTGGLALQGGTLMIRGNNTYTGSTQVLFGTLIVAANAGTTGALGNSATTIALGVDSTIYHYAGGTSSGILIDGDYTIARPISLTNGTFKQTLGAEGTTSGATFSGNIALTTAGNVELLATSASDRVTFTGGIIGGTSPGTVTIDGLGTVSFSGAGQSYQYSNATNVLSGSLRIESRATMTNSGTVTVSSGARFVVNGSITGNTAVALNGGYLGGKGTVGGTFTVASGATLAPGDGTVGTLSTSGETWGSGGKFQLGIADANTGMGLGWDAVNISGALSLSASSGTPFTLQLDSISSGGAPGLLTNFNPNTNYSWEFLSTSGGISGFNANAFTVDTSGFANAFNGAFSVSLLNNGEALALNYFAAPEPSPALLTASGGLLFLARRRRPRRAPRSTPFPS